MNDFDRPYDDHIAGNYPEPDKADLKNNWKVKLVLGILAAVIIAAIAFDVMGYIEKWG